MINTQLYLAIGIPIAFNFLLYFALCTRLDRLGRNVDSTRREVVSRIDRYASKVESTRLELVSRIDRVAAPHREPRTAGRLPTGRSREGREAI